METFGLGVAWNWEYDEDFVVGIEHACAQRGLSTFCVVHRNLRETLRRLHAGEISFRVFLDRAADDESFAPMVKALAKSPSRIINSFEHVEHAVDKATMHLEFITGGLHVPYTIIISPYNKKKEIELSLSELARLGRPFIIKPANTTGGGVGVVLGAESLKDVIETRQHHKNDKYLLQETVKPRFLDGNKAWFRVLFAFGETIPCWWDDITHIYRRVTMEEEQKYDIAGLRDAMKTIQRVSNLDFFSSEIVLTEEHKYVVVDYVNEVCDMRSQSKHKDGVPDDVVRRIQELIAEETARAVTI
jgi:glutathione synthase/RimK-type ligase-like ATP-grasp enzyme